MVQSNTCLLVITTASARNMSNIAFIVIGNQLLFGYQVTCGLVCYHFAQNSTLPYQSQTFVRLHKLTGLLHGDKWIIKANNLKKLFDLFNIICNCEILSVSLCCLELYELHSGGRLILVHNIYNYIIKFNFNFVKSHAIVGTWI